MSKITLNPVGSLIDTTTAANTININSVTVQNAFENTLSRDGTGPNQMLASLDMNSNRIINLPTPTGSLDAVRLVDLETLNGGGTINTLPTGGISSQVLTKNSGTNYDVSWQSPAGASTAQPQFGGRLTLTSGSPLITADVSSQNLYYAPYVSKTIPTYTAGIWTARNFTANSADQVGLTLNLAGSVNWAAGTTHDVFAVMDSGTLKLATRLWDAGMLPTETLITPVNSPLTTGTGANTWSNAINAFNGTTSQPFATCATVNPANAGDANMLVQNWGNGVTNVISKVIVYAPNDHSMLGSPGSTQFTTSVWGSNDGANWHLITIWRGNDSGSSGTVFTIPISVTETNAYQYHRVSFDGDTGANALRVAQIQFYKKVAAANGRRLTHNDGVLVNDAVITARTSSSTTISTAQFEGIYLGTIQIDAATAGQVSATVSYGTSRTYGVWNYYNRVPLKLQIGSYATFKIYPTDTAGVLGPPQRWTVCENFANGNIFFGSVIMGVAEEPIIANNPRDVYQNCISAVASYEVGIGVDTFLNFSGREGSCNIDTLGQAIGFQPEAKVVVQPVYGLKTFWGLERMGNSGLGTQSISTGPRHALMTVEWRG